MSKKIKFGALAIVLAAGTWFFFTPHLAASAMQKAADARDAETLASYVDFPAVKESLKAQLTAKLTTDVSEQQKDNPFAALGAAMAMAFVNPMIDAFITPEGLRQMMRGAKPKIGKGGAEGQGEGRGTANSGDSGLNGEVSMSYHGLNQFLITTKPKNGAEPVTFVLSRNGIASWKLTSIRLPL